MTQHLCVFVALCLWASLPGSSSVVPPTGHIGPPAPGFTSSFCRPSPKTFLLSSPPPPPSSLQPPAFLPPAPTAPLLPPAPYFNGSSVVDVFSFNDLRAAVADPHVRLVVLRRNIVFDASALSFSGNGLSVGLEDRPDGRFLRGPLTIQGDGQSCASAGPFVDPDDSILGQSTSVLRPDLCVIDAASHFAVTVAQQTSSHNLTGFNRISRHFLVAPDESLTLRDLELRHGVHLVSAGSVQVQRNATLVLHNVHLFQNTLGAQREGDVKSAAGQPVSWLTRFIDFAWCCSGYVCFLRQSPWLPAESLPCACW